MNQLSINIPKVRLEPLLVAAGAPAGCRIDALIPKENGLTVLASHASVRHNRGTPLDLNTWLKEQEPAPDDPTPLAEATEPTTDKKSPKRTKAVLPMLLFAAALLLPGCASVSLVDPSGVTIKRTVPIWSSKTALGEFSLSTDTNGIRTVKVLNHTQENSESINALLQGAIAGALAGLKASQTGGF